MASPGRGRRPAAGVPPARRGDEKIVPIGTWALWSLARHALAFRAASPGVSVSIVVPGGLLASGQLLRILDRVLSKTGVDPWALLLVFTEKSVEQLGPSCRTLLRDVAERGVRLGLDEIWPGRFNTELIETLPFDVLKLDMTLVGDLRDGSTDAEAVRQAIDAGRRRGRRIVARGVTSEARIPALRSWGCNSVQGLAPPLVAEDVPQMLRTLRLGFPGKSV